MNSQQIEQLLTSLASLGAAIAAGVAPAAAGTLALSVVLRELPHLFGLAAIIMNKGKLTDEQVLEAHTLSTALTNPSTIPPA